METMKVGTRNPEKHLVVTRNRKTRVVAVPGFGMVGLGKVDDSMVVGESLCSVMGFGAQTCHRVSADCSGLGFLVDVCWVGECFVKTCYLKKKMRVNFLERLYIFGKSYV